MLHVPACTKIQVMQDLPTFDQIAEVQNIFRYQHSCQ